MNAENFIRYSIDHDCVRRRLATRKISLDHNDQWGVNFVVSGVLNQSPQGPGIFVYLTGSHIT